MTNLKKGPMTHIINDCYGCHYCAFDEKNWMCTKLDYKILVFKTLITEDGNNNNLEIVIPDRNCPYLESKND